MPRPESYQADCTHKAGEGGARFQALDLPVEGERKGWSHVSVNGTLLLLFLWENNRSCSFIHVRHLGLCSHPWRSLPGDAIIIIPNFPTIYRIWRGNQRPRSQKKPVPKGGGTLVLAFLPVGQTTVPQGNVGVGLSSRSVHNPVNTEKKRWNHSYPILIQGYPSLCHIASWYQRRLCCSCSGYVYTYYHDYYSTGVSTSQSFSQIHPWDQELGSWDRVRRKSEIFELATELGQSDIFVRRREYRLEELVMSDFHFNGRLSHQGLQEPHRASILRFSLLTSLSVLLNVSHHRSDSSQKQMTCVVHSVIQVSFWEYLILNESTEY